MLALKFPQLNVHPPKSPVYFIPQCKCRTESDDASVTAKSQLQRKMLASSILRILTAGLLALCCLMTTALGQQQYRVGLGFGYGRSYQLGTPDGTIERPYQRFRSGSNHLLTLWYENEMKNNPWTLRGGFSWAERGYWLSQERFANNWFRGAYFKAGPTYDYVSLWMSAGYSLLDRERIKLEAFAGLCVSFVGLTAFGSASGVNGANVTPLEYRVEYDYEFSQREFTTVEPIGGLNLRWRTERKLFRRLSYWLAFSVPTRSLDYIGYRMEETYGNQTTVYEGRWRTRMLSWTLGLSYDMLSWGGARRPKGTGA